ncbi:hypothetical protein NPX13_g2759 [Xylaria arbuscula]|uniref:Uncharacterized protein n=1 Tax=Xylaria arbuscula TaxID=114810 RepID=A0A9W8TNV0_9PEZI|nr:hypothetical protein NPX13_g2759 [Xylaria arbuscula]
MMQDSAQDNMPIGDYNMPDSNFNPENGPAPAVQPLSESQQNGPDAPIDGTDPTMGSFEMTNGDGSTSMPATQDPTLLLYNGSRRRDGAPPATITI